MQWTSIVLEKEKARRAALLNELSGKLVAQRKQAENLQRDEQRMSGLVDKLTRLIREQAEAERKRQEALAAARAKAKAEAEARALARAQARAAAKAERATWEHRVALLRSEQIDRDLLEERARVVLGRVHANDVVVITP